MACYVFVYRGGRRRKTIKLSRDLSDLVVFTNSVVSQECLDEGKTFCFYCLPAISMLAKACLHYQSNMDADVLVLCLESVM